MLVPTGYAAPRIVVTARLEGGWILGCATFVNTLRESDVLAHKQSDSPETSTKASGSSPSTLVRTVPRVFHMSGAKRITIELEEEGVRIALAIIDTSGFGGRSSTWMAWGPGDGQCSSIPLHRRRCENFRKGHISRREEGSHILWRFVF